MRRFLVVLRSCGMQNGWGTLVLLGLLAGCGSGGENCSGAGCGEDTTIPDGCRSGGCEADQCGVGGCLDHVPAMDLVADAPQDIAADTPDVVQPLRPVAEACAGLACQPTVLMASNCKPERILVDAKDIYWMERCKGEMLGEQANPVFKLPAAGGEVTEFQYGDAQMQDEELFWQTETMLYVFNQGCCVNGYSFTINRSSKQAASWEWFDDLSSGKTIDYAVGDDNHFYYAMEDMETYSDRRALWDVPVQGGTSAQKLLAYVDIYRLEIMMIDDDSVYMIGTDVVNFDSWRVYAVSRAAGAVTLLAQLPIAEYESDSWEPWLRVGQQDQGNLYFFFGGTLVRVGKKGNQDVSLLLKDAGEMLRLAEYGDYLYYSHYGSIDPQVSPTEGSIWAIPKTGGTPVQLAAGQDGPIGIAAGPYGLYWVNTEGQQVMHLSP